MTEFHPLLEKSLAFNCLAAPVRLHVAALLDRSGPIEMLQNPVFLGSGHIAIAHVSERYRNRQAAKALTLDSMLTDDAPVDPIRLDVEGTEILALHGAEAVLHRSPRVRIVLEWSPVMLRSHCDPVAGAAWLPDLGFRAWRIQRGFLRPWRSWWLKPVAMTDLPCLDHGEVLLSRSLPSPSPIGLI